MRTYVLIQNNLGLEKPVSFVDATGGFIRKKERKGGQQHKLITSVGVSDPLDEAMNQLPNGLSHEPTHMNIRYKIKAFTDIEMNLVILIFQWKGRRFRAWN